MKRLCCPLVFVFLLALVIILFAGHHLAAQEKSDDKPVRACRSVHLAFPAEEGTAFYNELTITQSEPGTYFMACGFSKGYFGIQELVNGTKVVLFSVWEPGKQNNPNAPPEERRVKVVATGKGSRAKRFGGEGTGGQSFYDYDWKIGQRCRFVVYARAAGERTEYAGYFYVPEENRWQHLTTLSTLADGDLLRGRYSFIEDFWRNGMSAKKSRRAHFGNAWTLIDNKWSPLEKARFTADPTPTLNIDAGAKLDRFFLATGGETKNATTKLRDFMTLKKAERKPPLDLPDPFGDGSTSNRRIRVLAYNIKHGRGNDGVVDLERTASVIRRLNPDVVALQEVDNVCERSRKVNEPKLLASITGLDHHAFGSFFDYQGGKYGMAVLSRFPIAESNNLRLPDGAEPRTSLISKIQVDKEHSFSLADVHFYRSEEERTDQASTLLKELETIKGEVVVAGDFNSRPGTKVMKLFEDDWNFVDKGSDRFTFSSENPDREIDFAFTRRDSKLKTIAIDVIDEPLISDHRPLVLDLEWYEK